VGAGLAGYVIPALLALACGFGGAYLYLRFLAEPAAANPATAASGSPDSGPNPAYATADDARSLREQIDRLSEQVDQVKKRVDDLPKSVDSSDLESLRVRLADLAEANNTLSPLPGKVEHLDSRVSELSEMIRSIRDDLASLRSWVGGPDRAEPAPHSRADSGPRVTTPAPLDDRRRPARPASAKPADRSESRAMARGAELFRGGRYKDALGVFDRLEISYPDDARVWYYAALSDGFANNSWNGGAVRLVEKGIAREQAGTPPKAEIDAEFHDLTTENGKDWLAAYRKRVNPPASAGANPNSGPGR
jgi:hypothetical protein